MGYSQYGRIANTCPKRETVRLGDTQYARPASCSRPVRARAARRAGYAVVARPPAASYPLRTAPPSSLAQQAAPLPLTCPRRASPVGNMCVPVPRVYATEPYGSETVDMCPRHHIYPS